MKHKIKNSGHGWYIFACNYKDVNDNQYVNLFFPYESPEFVPNNEGKCNMTIDIEEGKLDCYKGKVGFTVFKWHPIEDAPEYVPDIQEQEEDELIVEDSDLPFY